MLFSCPKSVAESRKDGLAVGVKAGLPFISWGFTSLEGFPFYARHFPGCAAHTIFCALKEGGWAAGSLVATTDHPETSITPAKGPKGCSGSLEPICSLT